MFHNIVSTCMKNAFSIILRLLTKLFGLCQNKSFSTLKYFNIGVTIKFVLIKNKKKFSGMKNSKKPQKYL